ncbi:hypothetical protein GCM10010988_31520 [Cnuibacter physcomitrellae]|uniref:Stress responsive alpha-beta barrel domain-containing protein n=1 Tax=Cnuibacter physcomitrellae TaxID=1619308 RepID=A0A1X9LGP6_9MICO|nr:Dabb family protein [Cnuibacter physcomitrellae]ARJ04386.1 stress responsive alpha-beta barrel domain-containing protein [Cnuibacter physcomitrellae]GGI40924.1 hypothetical protein GCM10010988_31520 [Cnuibacter physcomitrellae]
MIRHVVAWKLATTDPAQKEVDAARIVAELSALVGVVDSIRSLQVGANMAYADRNWDVVLVGDFDDLAGLEAYQEHPSHVAAAAVVRSLVAERASVDIEV